MNISKLESRKIYKNFFQGDKTLEVLKGIDVTFDQNKSYAIIGVSGSGKSTLLHILGGLDNPSSGEILFNEKNIFKFYSSEKENFLNRHLGFIFQFHYLIKELSILENIMLMGLIKGDDKNECKKRAEILLNHVGLEDKAKSYPTQLSGGQLQRVSVLRAIFNKPDFLLADEPTGDLDSDNASLIVNLLLQCKKEWGMGIIICSHDIAVYDKMENIFRLHNGVLEHKK